MRLIVPLPVAALPTGGAAMGGSDEDRQLDAAYQRFAAAPLEARREVLAEITGRLKIAEHPGLLARIDRARKELTVVPAPPPACHDPDIYTPGGPRP